MRPFSRATVHLCCNAKKLVKMNHAPNFVSEFLIQQILNPKQRIMKRVLFTMLSLVLLSVQGEKVSGSCLAKDIIPIRTGIPYLITEYSYYDYNENVLHVFNPYVTDIVTVFVTYQGDDFLFDTVATEEHATYDFSYCESGEYHVTIFAGTMLLSSYNIIKY